MRSAATALLMVTWLTLASAAALAQAGDETRSAELAAAVAPFVDAQTLAVIHTDLAAFDAAEAIDALVEFFHLSQADRDHYQAQIVPINVVSQSVPPDGHIDLFLVVSASDLAKVPLFVVMPLEPGSPSAAVALEIRRGLAGQFRTEIVTEEIEGSLVTGTPLTLARLKRGKTVARPEIAAAFRAAGETELQMLIIPTADARRLMELLYPTLPPALGGGPTREVTQHFEWLALGFGLPPNETSLRTVVQAPSKESAAAVAGSVTALVASLTEDSQLEPAEVEELTGRIVPSIDGTRVTVDVTASIEEVADYGALLAPLLSMASGLQP